MQNMFPVNPNPMIEPNLMVEKQAQSRQKQA